MNAPLSLTQLIAFKSGKGPIAKPLSEGAVAALTQTISELVTASENIDALAGELQHCKVQFDVRPFRLLRDYIDDAIAAIQPAMLAHLDGLDAERKARAL